MGALERTLARPQEIVIVGDPAEPGTQALLGEVRGRFLPNNVVALAPSADVAAELAESVPLLAGRFQLDGKPTACVCENFACQMPVTDPRDLARQLDT